jgi:capsular polysaccharide transport system permease protein
LIKIIRSCSCFPRPIAFHTPRLSHDFSWADMSSGHHLSVSSVGSGLRRYIQVILALLRKEELKRRRAPMESIANLLEPVMLLGTMAFLWWFLDRRQFTVFGGSPLLFYATGFFVVYFFVHISRRMRQVGRSARRFPIERRLDHVFVHILLRVGDYALLGILVFGGMYFFLTPDAIPRDPVPVAMALIATVMIGFGWGIFNLVVSNKIPFVNYFFMAFNRGMIFVSGVLFIPDFFQPAVRHAFSYNPIMHIVILFRQGFYPTYPSNLLDTSYLALCCLAAVAGGLVLERVTARD